VPLTTDILYAGQLTDRAAAEIVEELQAIGLTAELREVGPRRTVGEITWLALMAVPLQPLYEQLAKDFAADAYKRLKTLTGKILRQEVSAPPNEGRKVLVLQDSDSGVQVALEADLPDEAYQQLLSFNLFTIRRGPLHYDRHRRRWRSELDEAERRPAPPDPRDRP
jgi:hypothetical protein